MCAERYEDGSFLCFPFVPFPARFLFSSSQSPCHAIERRSVTSPYHWSKFSGSQLFLLTETAICIVERWKKSMDYHFDPECNHALMIIKHAQESHTCQFFPFFCHFVCWDPGDDSSVLVYNIYTVYSNVGIYLTNKRKKEKKEDNGFNIEVYGGQRSMAFELTTAVLWLEILSMCARCHGKYGQWCETVIYM